MKRIAVLALPVLLLSIIIAAGSVSFLGPCVHEDGACHWAGQALLGTGILLAAESLFALFCGDSRVRQGVYFSMIFTACLGCLIPGTLIDLCHMATMRCRALMQPAMRILFLISVVISIIGYFQEKHNAHDHPGSQGRTESRT